MTRVFVSRLELGRDFADALSAQGIPSELVFVQPHTPSAQLEEMLEGTRASLCIIDTLDTHVLSAAAFMLGRGVSPLIIKPPDLVLPVIFSRCVQYDLGQKELLTRVAEALNDAEEGTHEAAPLDRVALLSWLRERPTRLSTLSERDFERVIRYWLTDAGVDVLSGVTDSPLICQERRTRSRVFVQCKNYRSGRKVGLDVVHGSATAAADAGCDFVLLATNTDLTDAGLDYIGTCTPRVIPIGRTVLEDYFLKGAWNHTPSYEPPWFVGAGMGPSKRNDDQLSSLLPFYSTAYQKALGIIHRPEEDDRPRMLFVTHNRKEHTEGVAQIARRFASMARLSHDSAHVQDGHCLHAIGDLRSAARTASVIVLLDSIDVPLHAADLMRLQVVADEIAKAPDRKRTVIVICEDVDRSKLRMPWRLAGAHFVDAWSGWYDEAVRWLSERPAGARPSEESDENLSET
jgi:hypothetical protein